MVAATTVQVTSGDAMPQFRKMLSNIAQAFENDVDRKNTQAMQTIWKVMKRAIQRRAPWGL